MTPRSQTDSAPRARFHNPQKFISSGSSTKKHRRQRGLLIVGLTAVLVGVAGGWLNLQWQATQRREAYLPALEEQARLTPTDGPLLALVGGRRAQAGEWAAAADALRHAFAAGENNENIWLVLASVTAASGDARLARADLDLGLRALPDSQMLQGASRRVFLLGAKAAPPALAAAISPQGPQSLVTRYTPGSSLDKISRARGRQHPEQSGYATREDWVRQQPNDAQAQRLWGLALMENRRFGEANSALAQAVTLAPDSPPAHLALARCLGQLNQPGQALNEYLLCLKLRPRWLDALLGLGAVADTQKLNGMAISAYAQATKIAPDSSDAWIGLGRALLQAAGKASQTLSTFQTAARLAPDRTDFFPDYATALRQSARPDEAETLLRKRLADAPTDAFAHYLLAGLLTENKPSPDRDVESEKHLREALRLIPREPLAEIRLAQLLLRRRSGDEAVALLTDALRQNPYNVNAMRILARAFGQTGQPELGKKVASQADVLFEHLQRISVLKTQVAKNFLDPKPHDELADLYERSGQPEQAAYERSLLHLIRTDPKRAQQTVQEHQQELRQALPGS